MVTEFDFSCTNCGGELTPVEVSIDGDPGTGSKVRRLAECIECSALHYPEQALENQFEVD